MLQPIDPKSQSHSPNHSTEQPSKIKPLIFHTPKASDLCEPHIYIQLKRSKKNLMATRLVSYCYGDRNLDYSRKIIKILQKLNSPSELEIVSTCPEVFPNRYFFSKIRNLASSAPPRLTLESSIAQSGLKPTLKNLSSLKNLTHLNFGLPHGVNEDPQVLKTFFFSLNRLKKLRHLSIDIHHLKDGKKISSYIARFSQLQSLKLRIGDTNIVEFTTLLPNLPNLTKFSLHLYGNHPVPSEDFLAFFMGFQYTKALRDITLDFGDCSLSKPTDIEPLSEGLKALNPSLMKKLRLKLCSKIPTEDLIKIFKAIKKFKRLQLFDLFIFNFEANKVTGSLGSALSELCSLSSLKICLDALDENKYAMLDIAAALESLQNLAFLEIYFKREENTKDEPIQKFSSSLKKLQGLQYLHVQFGWQKYISDLAFESLSEGLKELMNLKNLRLIFESAQGLTDKGVSAFCRAVKGLKNLTGLTLKLREGDDIDEKAICEIAQMLREMPQLSEVYFSFDKCAKIKNKENALESLFLALKELKNIKKIILVMDSSAFNKKAFNDLKVVKGNTVSWRWI